MSDPSRIDTDALLRRLLGPAAAELGCEQCFEELDHYVELELTGADADAAIPGMRAHLEGCAACNEEHASLRAFAASETGPPAADRLAD